MILGKRCQFLNYIDEKKNIFTSFGCYFLTYTYVLNILLSLEIVPDALINLMKISSSPWIS